MAKHLIIGASAAPPPEPLAPRAANNNDAAHILVRLLLRALRRFKWVFAASVVLGMAVGFFIFLTKPLTYRAYATMELLGFNEGFMNMQQVDTQANTGQYNASQMNIQTQLRILESNSLRAQVLQRIEESSVPSLNPTNMEFARLRRILQPEVNNPINNARTAARWATRTFSARAVPGTRIIALNCESTSPDIAAAFLNTMANEFILQSMQSRTLSAQKTAQWLSTQTEEARLRLQEAENKLQEYIRGPGSLFAAETETLTASRLRSVQADLAAAQTERIRAQNRAEMARQASPDVLGSLFNEDSIRSLQTRKGVLEQELAALLQKVTSEHPKARQLQAQIQTVSEAIATEQKRLRDKLDSELVTIQKKEQMLQGAYNRQNGAMVGVSNRAAEYQALKREAEMARQTYVSLLQQSNSANMVSAVPTTNVRLIDSAVPPPGPEGPRLVPFLGLGAATGLVASIMLSLLLLLWQERKHMLTFMAPGHLSPALHLPELGAIPNHRFDPEPKPRRLFRPKAQAALTSESAESSRTLLFDKENRNLAAESFRVLLVSLLMPRPGKETPKVICFTSANPHEGKTTMVANVAGALAEAGKRTLILDADLRRPVIAKTFGLASDIPSFPELVQRVAASSQPAAPLTMEDLNPYIVPSGRSNLSILASAPIHPNEVNGVLYSEVFGELLQLARHNFDVVLIDTPPVLPFSDARRLAAMADGAVMVIRAGVTNRSAAEMASRRLIEDHANILGAVLNDWTPDVSSSEHASYYAQHYYSRQETTSGV